MRSEARETFGQRDTGQQQQPHERGAGDWTGYQPQSAVLASIAARQSGPAAPPALPPPPAGQQPPGPPQPPQPAPAAGQPAAPPAAALPAPAPAASAPAVSTSAAQQDGAAAGPTSPKANGTTAAKSRAAARPSYFSKPVLNENAQQQTEAGGILQSCCCSCMLMDYMHWRLLPPANMKWSSCSPVGHCRGRRCSWQEGAAARATKAAAGQGHCSCSRSWRRRGFPAWCRSSCTTQRAGSS